MTAPKPQPEHVIIALGIIGSASAILIGALSLAFQPEPVECSPTIAYVEFDADAPDIERRMAESIATLRRNGFVITKTGPLRVDAERTCR